MAPIQSFSARVSVLRRYRRLSALLAVGSLALHSASAQITFRGLGDLTGGTVESRATAVSGDGAVVVGYSTSTAGVEAFRWTADGGIVGLGKAPNALAGSKATGVSADGSTVVGGGSGSFNYGEDTFRWTETSGLVALGDPANNNYLFYARGVSADGTLIAGNGGGGLRWHLDGTYDVIPAQAGGSYANGQGISGDGKVVVGDGNSTGGNIQAFRWVAGSGTESLGFLSGGSYDYSYATAANSDGSVVIGASNSAGGFQGFVWQEGVGMVGLGDLEGGTFSSLASGVSADGAIVVGSGNSAAGSEAIFWTEATGMVSIYDFISGQGVDLSDWTSLNGAAAISADGTAIVGSGIHNGITEAFLITGFSTTLSAVPEPSSFALLAGLGILGATAMRRRRAQGADSTANAHA